MDTARSETMPAATASANSFFGVRAAAVVTTLLLVGAIGPYKLSFPMRVTVDCLELLRCGQLVAAGKLPCVEVVEINPPAILYLNVLPSLFSQWSGIHVIPSLIFCVCLLCLYAAVASIIALREASLPERKVVPMAVLSLSAAILPLCKLELFGQREMLLLLCFLPFFWLRWVRWNGGSPHIIKAAVIGTIAGIGLSIKPHFLILPICTELYWAAKSRSIRYLYRPEMVACLIVGLTYLAHFLLCPAPMREQFFGVIVPVMLEGYSFPRPVEALAFAGQTPQCWFSLLAAVIAALLARRCSLLGPLLAFTCGGFLVYFLQFKPFFYHLSVFFAGALILAACELCLLASVVERKKEWTLTPIFASCCLGLGLVAFILSFLEFTGDRTKVIADGLRRPVIELLLRETRPDDSVLFLQGGTPGYSFVMPTGRMIGSRYPAFALLAAAQLMEQQATATDRRQFAHQVSMQILQNIAEDIGTFKPKLIFVPPANPSAYPTMFSPEFLSEILAQYEPAGCLDGSDVYSRRVEPGSTAVKAGCSGSLSPSTLNSDSPE